MRTEYRFPLTTLKRNKMSKMWLNPNYIYYFTKWLQDQNYNPRQKPKNHSIIHFKRHPLIQTYPSNHKQQISLNDSLCTVGLLTVLEAYFKVPENVGRSQHKVKLRLWIVFTSECQCCWPQCVPKFLGCKDEALYCDVKHSRDGQYKLKTTPPYCMLFLHSNYRSRIRKLYWSWKKTA